MALINHLTKRKLNHFNKKNILSRKLLLDIYSNSSFAYSTKLLSSNYFGPCIKVRRSSDNTTQDIYFVGEQLDNNSLTNFTGINDGFIDTWYDQSGRGINLTQTTNGSQPQIVSAGVTNIMNAYYYVDFDGTNDYLENTTAPVISSSFFTLSALFKADVTNATNSLLVSLQNGAAQSQIFNNGFYNYANSANYGNFAFTDIINSFFNTSIFNGNKIGNSERLTAYLNQTKQTLTFTGTIPSSVSGTGINLGRPYGVNAAYFNGRLMQVVGWPIDFNRLPDL